MQADREAADARRARRLARRRIDEETLRTAGLDPDELAVADIARAAKKVRHSR